MIVGVMVVAYFAPAHLVALSLRRCAQARRREAG
jgi:hypothetical protein